MFDVQPDAFVNVILYEPAANDEIVYGSVTLDTVPVAEPDQFTVPVPLPFTCMLPVVVEHEVGFVIVPAVIEG